MSPKPPPPQNQTRMLKSSQLLETMIHGNYVSNILDKYENHPDSL